MIVVFSVNEEMKATSRLVLSFEENYNKKDDNKENAHCSAKL